MSARNEMAETAAGGASPTPTKADESGRNENSEAWDARRDAVPANGDPEANWAVTVASLLVGAGFFALWFWLLPGWLGFHVDIASVAGWRWIAAIPSVLGFAVALRCVWDFGRTGHGTPAPMAPPRRLVVVGFYCYVRNPMYVGFLTGWTGLWVVFGRASRGALEVAAVAVTTVALFVRFYEEPTLRTMFGGEYEEYCRNVGRWVPRLQPWKKK